MKMVDWRFALPMAIAAVAGGYGAAGLAKRIGRIAVRRFVIAVGFGVSIFRKRQPEPQWKSAA